jgi:hypothetical protein
MLLETNAITFAPSSDATGISVVLRLDRDALEEL